ncbi:DUF2141 domain-containing protein [Flavobacteriaceae bacterium M23B6Z8]
MKKIIFLVCTLILTMSFTNETYLKDVENGEINVTVNTIKSKKGQIVFMLFNQDKGFPKETEMAFKKGIVTQFNETASYSFQNIPYGKYAVVVFHDEDSDGEIASNFIGMPKEPVGASNLNRMSKPTFKKCAFDLNEGKKKISLKFINK